MNNEEFVKQVRETKTAKITQSDSTNLATKHELQIFLEEDNKWKTVFSSFDLDEVRKVMNNRKDKKISNFDFAVSMRRPLPESRVKRRR